MNAPYISPAFPHRDDIRAAALLDMQIAALKAQNQPVPMTLVRQAQHAQALYNNLSPFEQGLVRKMFNADLQEAAQAIQHDVEAQTADAEQQQVDNVMRDLTHSMNDGRGYTLAQAMALRSGERVRTRTRKLPTGEEAEARVRAATAHLTADGKGLSEKEYERRLLRLHEIGPYSERYDQLAQQYFPNVPRHELDKLVRRSLVDSVGVEMRRRYEAKQPDHSDMRPLSDEEKRRIDLIESIVEVEQHNPRSPFQRTIDDRVRQIATEEQGSVRGDIAAVIDQAGGMHNIDWANRGEPVGAQPEDYEVDPDE